MNSFIFDHLLSFSKRFRCQVTQYFEAISRLADQRTQSNRYRQPDHSGSRNSDTHRILQDVGAQKYFRFLRFTA